MTEEQKRFKILQKKSYEQQISEKKEEEIESALKVGLSISCLFIMALGKVIFNDDSNFTKWLEAVYVVLFSLNIGLNFYSLIDAFWQKTILQDKLEYIVDKPEMLEKEKVKSIRIR